MTVIRYHLASGTVVVVETEARPRSVAALLRQHPTKGTTKQTGDLVVWRETQ